MKVQGDYARFLPPLPRERTILRSHTPSPIADDARGDVALSAEECALAAAWFRLLHRDACAAIGSHGTVGADGIVLPTYLLERLAVTLDAYAEAHATKAPTPPAAEPAA